MHKPYIHVDRRAQGNTHGSQRPWRVILHSTESHDRAGNADIIGVLKYLEGTSDGLGIHFVVDREGRVGQGASVLRLCYHARGANTDSVGIEMIGFAKFSVKTWYRRRRQLKKVARLLAYLSIRFDIPLKRSTTHGVCLHRDFPAGGHWDPGYGFPTRRVLRWARQIKAKELA
jgi:N-acetyl-anhydromuramyl-L-alanine amidase AmpD